MKFKPLILSASLAVGLSSCATKSPAAKNPMSASGFAKISKNVTVAFMEPDVEIKYNRVGSTDLRVDWSEEAEANLKAAVIAHLKGSGETVIEFQNSSITQDELDQLLVLNEQVNTAMGQHVVDIGNTEFLGELPHKKDKSKELSYSLGDAIRPIKVSTKADYAVFVNYRAVIESNGQFMTTAAFAALISPVFLAFNSDFRGTMINLVDLNTGEVVWLNADTGGNVLSSDARKTKNATKTISKILDDGPFVEVRP